MYYIYKYDFHGFEDYTEVITKCHQEKPRVIKKCTVSKMVYYLIEYFDCKQWTVCRLFIETNSIIYRAVMYRGKRHTNISISSSQTFCHSFSTILILCPFCSKHIVLHVSETFFRQNLQN